jgi:hypothetical protein
VDGKTVLPIGNTNSDHDAFLWAKVQCLMLLHTYEFDQAVLRGAEERLNSSVARGDISDLVRQINEYFMFGLGDPNETMLDLWTDHRIEHRGKSHSGLIKLGSAPCSEFSIRKSLVVLNHPNDQAAGLQGTHAFLVHEPTNSVFSLDSRRLNTLEKSRPIRIADRDHVDFQWDLYRFFDSILNKKANSNTLHVFQADVDRGTYHERRYGVSVKPPRIEVQS